jgi:hypothetical protein
MKCFCFCLLSGVQLIISAPKTMQWQTKLTSKIMTCLLLICGKRSLMYISERLHYAQPFGYPFVCCHSSVGSALISQGFKLFQSEHERFRYDAASVESLVLRQKLSAASLQLKSIFPASIAVLLCLYEQAL